MNSAVHNITIKCSQDNYLEGQEVLLLRLYMCSFSFVTAPVCKFINLLKLNSLVLVYFPKSPESLTKLRYTFSHHLVVSVANEQSFMDQM